MKKEAWIIVALAAIALLYFSWPHVRTSWAFARSIFNQQRSFVVTGTANSGNDSGGVLTQACN